MDYQIDPLNEKEHEVLPGLIWKYENRALLLTTLACPAHCPFCFRMNLYTPTYQRASNEEVFNFISTHPSIREFIFSGGEPLLMIQDVEALVMQLKTLPTMSVFRIHTRLPIVQPGSVPLKRLARLIQNLAQPFFIVLHVNTIQELTPEVEQTIINLRKAGYILLSHSVFLAGINDSVPALSTLFSRLIELGVKPYYIFHCDHLPHTERYEVPLEREQQIMTELRKQVTGIAYPLHVIDSTSGKGKIPVPTNFWRSDLSLYADFEQTWLPLKKAKD